MGRGTLRLIYRLGIYCLISYLALCLLMFLFQRRLLYLPSRHPIPASGQEYGLRLWPQVNEHYLGYLGGAIQPEARGTVVVFHGNAGSARDRGYFAEALGELGFRVLLAEYPGYGARSGKPSQKALVEQAQHIIRQVKDHFPGPVFLWGESLGAGVVAAAAAETSDVDGLVLLTPWDSLTEVAQSLYWFLPVRLLIKDRYASSSYLSNYQGPVAVVLAENDEIIPIHHGEKLFNSLQSPKKRWVFAGAGHNSWPANRNEKWWQEVMDFVTKPK